MKISALGFGRQIWKWVCVYFFFFWLRNKEKGYETDICYWF